MKQLLVVIAAAAAWAEPANPPTFDQYFVKDVFKGRSVPPRLNTPFAHQFASTLRKAAKRGPNFAGKFTIARWGAGAHACKWR